MGRKIVVVLVVLVAALGVGSFASAQTNADQAKQALKQANELSARQEYVAATAKYEEAIRLDPALVDAYAALAKMQDAATAEQTLISAVNANPRDGKAYGHLADYYTRLGQFDKTIDAYRQWADVQPSDAEPCYSIAAYYWDKAYRDSKLTVDEKRDYATKGIQAADEALALKADYVEALVMKGLLLRVLATVETDRAKCDDLMRQAMELAQKAQEIQRKRR